MVRYFPTNAHKELFRRRERIKKYNKLLVILEGKVKEHESYIKKTDINSFTILQKQAHKKKINSNDHHRRMVSFYKRKIERNNY